MFYGRRTPMRRFERLKVTLSAFGRNCKETRQADRVERVIRVLSAPEYRVAGIIHRNLPAWHVCQLLESIVIGSNSP